MEELARGSSLYAILLCEHAEKPERREGRLPLIMQLECYSIAASWKACSNMIASYFLLLEQFAILLFGPYLMPLILCQSRFHLPHDVFFSMPWRFLAIRHRTTLNTHYFYSFQLSDDNVIGCGCEEVLCIYLAGDFVFAFAESLIL